MFIVSLSYKKEISEVERFLDLHKEFLDRYYAEKKFIFSGGIVPRTGGIILVRNVDKTALHEIMQQDPFYIYEVADYEIVEVNPTKYDEDFASFIE